MLHPFVKRVLPILSLLPHDSTHLFHFSFPLTVYCGRYVLRTFPKHQCKTVRLKHLCKTARLKDFP